MKINYNVLDRLGYGSRKFKKKHMNSFSSMDKIYSDDSYLDYFDIFEINDLVLTDDLEDNHNVEVDELDNMKML
jgi:hypothetical protein